MGWRHPGRFFLWGFIAFLAVIGTIAPIGLVFFRPATFVYYPFGFFPFGLFALFWIFAIFFVLRWLFFPWRWGAIPATTGEAGLRRPRILHPPRTIHPRRDHEGPV